MKHICGLVLMMLLSLNSFGADCGKVSSYSFDYDTGSVVGFFIDLKFKKVRVTKDNSPKLATVVRDYVWDAKSLNDVGLFVCLDKYSTYVKNYKGKKRSYARVQEYRLWNKGTFLGQSPANMEMKDLADQVGEYFSAYNTEVDGHVFKNLDNNSLPAKLEKKVESIVEERNEYLAPQGGVYSYSVIEVLNAETGELIGYVVAIEDGIDHPLWDGSGLTIYLDKKLTVVDSVEWSG